MTQKTISLKRFTGKLFIFCLLLWLIVSSISYFFVHILEDSRRQALVKIGVAISKEISSQSGLPLLERKIERLMELIDEVTEKPEVIFASIIDHKNKLIAYTDQDQFLTFRRKNSGELEGVNYWRVSNHNQQKVMNFSSEITFSGTRVGEVFISLAAENIGSEKRSVLFFSALVLIVMALIFCFTRYGDLVFWRDTKKPRFRQGKETVFDPKESQTCFCPLCGNLDNFSMGNCNKTEIGSFLLIKSYSHTKGDVLLGDLGKIEELSWLNKHILTRCARIITTISD